MRRTLFAASAWEECQINREQLLLGVQVMDSLLQWLTQYSPPVVLLIAFGGSLVFILKNVTEKAISTEFDHYKHQIELKLEKRSNFEEKILLDRYLTIRDLETRIGRVMTDLNRLRHGTNVEGVIVNNDIVSLTEVFDLLAVNKYLITAWCMTCFYRKCRNRIDMPNNDRNDAEMMSSDIPHMRSAIELHTRDRIDQDCT